MDQLKLLIVDDEEGIVDMVQRIYEREGFLTFGATDGIKAIEIYEKERPEIVFIDVHMPFSPIDGLEVLKRIKEINQAAHCVMVTRIFDKPCVEKARSLGALHYLPKPFEIEDLDRCIAEIKNKIKKGE